MAYGQVSVGVTATLIVAANNNRRALIVDNQSASVTVYIGPDASITSSNAVSLRAGTELTLDDRWMCTNIYGITASSTATIGWWEVSP